MSQPQLEAILAVALDLASALTAADRYQRLLDVLRQVIPYDAAALLRLEGDTLVPLAARGLRREAERRPYVIQDHPRLAAICAASEPVRFAANSPLPDPFDGLLLADGGPFEHIHACLGCPLRIGDELIGALTADARAPDAFAALDPRFLAAVGALASVEVRTADLMDALERNAARQGLIARDLMRDVLGRRGGLLGASPLITHLLREIDAVGRSDLAVLISGETGTGKELVARAVHLASERRDEPMLYVNCAALPESLVESELFGHVRGAFTGATADRAGKFEVADGGTLFLDEVGELPLTVQPKLLRVLQHGEVQRVGAERQLSVDVRIIAASNRDLAQEVERGAFRADLYHRLNVYPIQVPPLRERGGDVIILAGHFCEVARRRLGLGPVRLAADAVGALEAYAWPGNVRELENLISRATVRASAQTARGAPVLLTAEDLALDPGRRSGPRSGATVGVANATAPAGEPIALKAAVDAYKRQLVEEALAVSDGSWAGAARRLGMQRGNLYHMAGRLGLR